MKNIAFFATIVILTSIAFAQTGSTVCTNLCGYASYGGGYYKAMCWTFTENTQTFTTPSGVKTWAYAWNSAADNDCKAYWGDSNSRCFCEGSAPPAKPTGLWENQNCQPDSVGDNLPLTITFNWNAAAGATSYQVLVWAPEQNRWLPGQIVYSPSDVWYNFPHAGTTHTWVVRAFNSAGFADSNQKSFQTITCILPTTTTTSTTMTTTSTTTTIPCGYLKIFKFDDPNANGVWEQGEATLPGFTFAVSGPAAFSAITGSGGVSISNCIPTGQYTVTEQVPAGWQMTTQNNKAVTVFSGILSEVRFGNRQVPTTTTSTTTTTTTSTTITTTSTSTTSTSTTTTTASTTTTSTTPASSTTSTTTTSTTTTTQQPQFCSNECLFWGQRECSGNNFRICGNFDSDNCFEWSFFSSCASTQVCVYGYCFPGGVSYQTPSYTYPTPGYGYQYQTPSSGCSNDCSYSQRRCNGNTVEFCGNFDSDSCYEWGYERTCNTDQQCSSGQCTTACVHECSPQGLTDCDGPNIYMFCGNFDNDPCNEWLRVSCANDEVCSNRRCVQSSYVPTPPSAGDFSGRTRTIYEQPVIQAQATTRQGPADLSFLIIIVLLLLIVGAAALFLSKRRETEEK